MELVEMEELLEKAESGDCDAQAKIGKYYYLGIEEFHKNYDKAAKYLVRAAMNGNIEIREKLEQNSVQCNFLEELAKYYFIEKALLNVGEKSKSLQEIENAFQNGDAKIQVVMGELLSTSIFNNRNNIKSIDLYKNAVNQNIPFAYKKMGDCYFFGDDVEKDYKKAKEYYEEGAKLGDIESIYQLAILYKTGKGVEVDLEKANELINTYMKNIENNKITEAKEKYFFNIPVLPDLVFQNKWYNSEKFGLYQIKQITCVKACGNIECFWYKNLFYVKYTENSREREYEHIGSPFEYGFAKIGTPTKEMGVIKVLGIDFFGDEKELDFICW